ncbi:MAG TPA: hypothetical protein VIM75_14585 [Ohtaekwangia sp.]|uniref:hypothetical protein n=1 Tax=Ohtaekwangia sp. TaxID=2066019 RepID=UPI002F9289FA
MMDTSLAEKLLSRIVTEMDTATSVIDALHKRGYTYNFELTEDKLICLQNFKSYFPDDFIVDVVYPLEGANNDLRECFVFALREPITKVKGIFYFTCYTGNSFSRLL